jgi:hypothetical protein
VDLSATSRVPFTRLSGFLWLVVPLAAGLGRRVLRAEVK